MNPDIRENIDNSEYIADAADSLANSASSLIDWEAVDQRYLGRQAFIVKLLATILDGAEEVLVKLRGAIQEHDLEAVDFLAHGLKGTGSNLAAQRLYDLAERTEYSAKMKQDDALMLAEALAGMLE